MPRRVVVGTFAAVLALAASTACTEQEERQSAPSDPCARIMVDVAMAREVPEQLQFLDTALVVCRSVDAFDRALAQHPGAIAVEAEEFVARRCDDPPTLRVESSTICRSVVTSTTTTTRPAPPEDMVYVGITLDGREFEISSRDTLFTEGRPSNIVQLVDIGTEDGCEGVEREFVRWMAFVDDPDLSDEASVYAQHALNVLAVLGCDPPE